ncbi:histidine kinase [Paenibacillus sp.]|uniref:cache domain-containing sensor histidine kinase n=1 Tax=Paenibacillus sp. TaxID=58172 RepID=UPI0028126047|nr:histidine kinase [Paenibacillus sp.]
MRKHWHYRFSVKTKILAMVFSVSFLSIVLMGAISSYYYTESAKKDFYLIAQDSTARINHQLDRYFNQLAQSTYSSIAGPLPSNPLLGNNPESGMIQKWLAAGQHFNREQEALVEDILTRYIAMNDSDILGVVLRSSDQRLLYSKDSSLRRSAYSSVPWIHSPFSETQRVIPSYFHKGKVAAYPFITIVVPIHSPETMQLIGNLNIALSITEIQNILGQVQLGKTGYFFIVDAAGEIVYHPDVQYVGRPLEDTALDGIQLTVSDRTIKLDGEKILLTYNRSWQTGWNIVAYVPMNEMASGLDVAKKSVLYITLCLILISLLSIPRMFHWIVHPIFQLRHLMKRVENGDLSVSAEVIPGKDEVQQLNRSFNQMTRRLNELVHTVHELEMKEMHLQLRQRDALIQALQNQINPHLLYNTLEIIKSIAFIEKVPAIEKMATNLAGVYRYTTKMAGSTVPLREELRNLERYLDIVHIRFGAKFTSEISVDPKFMDCLIIKLSLQPIVENCVKYAIEPKIGNASVRVRAYEENGDLLIDIADNGSGFPTDVLESLYEKMRSIEDRPEPSTREESIGILNVHARMRLTYGSPYGVGIRSGEGKGSIVTLRFPKKDKGNSEILDKMSVES